MAIWIEKQLVPASTLAVACFSSLAAGTIKQPREPERQLTFAVLQDLGKRMKAAGIKKFEDGFYHGLIHPYDAYDLVASMPNSDVTVKKKKAVSPQAEKLLGGYITVDEFRLTRTSGVGQMLLLGQTSRLLDLVPVWLLAKKDMPTPTDPKPARSN